MSHVTTVVIISNGHGSEEDNRLAKLNGWLKTNNHLGNPFVGESSQDSAGTKYPQRRLYFGGFNYLNHEDFIEFFKSLDFPESLLVLGYDNSESAYGVLATGYEKYDNLSDYPIKLIGAE